MDRQSDPVLCLLCKRMGMRSPRLKGLSSDLSKLHPLQEAFREKHGLQCGYCTAGFLMTMIPFLEENPNPTEAEIRDCHFWQYLPLYGLSEYCGSGEICRGTCAGVNHDEPLLVYGHPACPGVPPVKAMLTQAKVPFTYVNIHQDAQAAALVRSINQGNESVPTLVFPDGSTLTEPSANELKHKLEAMGYQIGLLAWVLGNSWLIVTGLIIFLRFCAFLKFSN